jgi:hypothetical protein
MAQIKGKFINMVVNFISSRSDIQEKARQGVKSLTGQLPSELEPEGWYDAKVINSVFETIRSNTDNVSADIMIQVAGMEIFYVIKETVDLPPGLDTALDWFKFEAESFSADHKGPDVIPRKFIKAEEGHVVIEAPSPGYDCTLIEGCYMGILRMNKQYDGKVKQTKCVKKNGDSTCVFDIRW